MQLLPVSAPAPELEAIYLESFPPEERRPFADIFSGRNPLKALAIHDGGRAVGLLTYWDFADFCYIEHFATSPAVRGRGIGSEALERFMSYIL